MNKYAGADWLECNGKRLSDFGREVADVLGQVFLGIYHIDRAVLRDNVDWQDSGRVSITHNYGLATFDSSELTRLVVLCHDRAIRLEIEGCGPYRMRLIFHRRDARAGELWERHPEMEEHIDSIRNAIGLGVVESPGGAAQETT